MDKIEDVSGMEAWKNVVQQDINELKNGQTQIKNENLKIKDDIRDLQFSDKMQDQEIGTLKDTLKGISEDTRWIRRKITGAIITAVITGLIGGVIAFFFAKF